MILKILMKCIQPKLKLKMAIFISNKMLIIYFF